MLLTLTITKNIFVYNSNFYSKWLNTTSSGVQMQKTYPITDK